jgi:hypothetical protein
MPVSARRTIDGLPLASVVVAMIAGYLVARLANRLRGR